MIFLLSIYILAIDLNLLESDQQGLKWIGNNKISNSSLAVKPEALEAFQNKKQNVDVEKQNSTMLEIKAIYNDEPRAIADEIHKLFSLVTRRLFLSFFDD